MARIAPGRGDRRRPDVPVAAQEAIHRYASERRAASYVVLTPAAAGRDPRRHARAAPELLQRAQEHVPRAGIPGGQLLALDAAALAKPEPCPMRMPRQRYEQQKARFGTPERRTIQQITFPSPGRGRGCGRQDQGRRDLRGASRPSATFAPADLELGTFTKAEMLDQAVADAAFALAAGRDERAGRRAASARCSSASPRSSPRRCGPSRRSRREIRQELAQCSAPRRQIETDPRRDRGSCAPAPSPLADIAKEKGLTLVQVPAVDAGGRDKAGNPVEPARDGRGRDGRLRLRYRRRQRGPAHGARRLCLVRRDRHRAGPREDPRRGARSGRAPVARGPGRPAPVREGRG